MWSVWRQTWWWNKDKHTGQLPAQIQLYLPVCKHTYMTPHTVRTDTRRLCVTDHWGMANDGLGSSSCTWISPQNDTVVKCVLEQARGSKKSWDSSSSAQGPFHWSKLNFILQHFQIIAVTPAPRRCPDFECPSIWSSQWRFLKSGPRFALGKEAELKQKWCTLSNDQAELTWILPNIPWLLWCWIKKPLSSLLRDIIKQNCCPKYY